MIAGCGADPTASVDGRDGFGGKLGLGVGVPYGGVGAGVELGVPLLAVVGGVGTTIFAGPGWAVGLRTYFVDRTGRLRPHVTGVYGVVGARWAISGPARSFMGIAGYAGVDHDVGAPGAIVLTYGLGIAYRPDVPSELDEDRTDASLLFGINAEL